MLGLLLFLTNVNDLPNESESYLIMLTDDAKIMREVRINRDCEILQRPRQIAAVVRQMAYGM